MLAGWSGAGVVAVGVLAFQDPLGLGTAGVAITTVAMAAVLMRAVIAFGQYLRALERSEQARRELAEANQLGRMGHWEWDVEADRVSASSELFRIVGLEQGPGWISYERYVDLLHPDDRERVEHAIAYSIASGEPLSYEARVVRPDERVHTLHVRGRVVRRRGGPKRLMTGTAQDVSERRAAEDFLRGVLASLAEAVYTVDEQGRLTSMNPAAEQLLGWREGDLLGRRVHEVVHPARCPEAECPLGHVQALTAAERVEDATILRGDGGELPVAYSASPLATATGAGGVVAFRDITERKAVERRLRGERDAFAAVAHTRKALDSGRMLLYAQPIVDLESGRPVQEELLLRMVGDDGRVAPTESYLPAAEELGLIRDLDRWVVEQAARLATGGRRLAVNLSAKSIGDPALLRAIERAVADESLAPGALMFEITETALTRDVAQAEEFARRIAELGCRLALDDFGTGYGSFTYLKRLPISHLKIDQEFVRGVTGDSANQHVIRAVVNLARDFGLRTVAEGVEDEATLEFVRMLGVDFAQGWLLGRPAPAERGPNP